MTTTPPDLHGTLHLRGEFDLIHIRDGQVISQETIPNLILNVGREYAAKLLNGMHTNPFKYIQLGTGTNAPAVTDTHLYTYYTEAEADASYTEGYRAVLSHTFTFSGSASIQEAGLCDGTHASSPKMLSRQVFSPRNVIADDHLQTTWRITAG